MRHRDIHLGADGVNTASLELTGIADPVWRKKSLRPPRIKNVRIVMAQQQFRAHSQPE
jgi:hypothetical protein